MAKIDKLFKRFMTSPPLKDLSFDELETLLSSFGFKKIEGKGSRVKFIHTQKEVVIFIHKPHPSNLLKIYVIKQIQEILKGFKDGNS